MPGHPTPDDKPGIRTWTFVGPSRRSGRLGVKYQTWNCVGAHCFTQQCMVTVDSTSLKHWRILDNFDAQNTKLAWWQLKCRLSTGKKISSHCYIKNRGEKGMFLLYGIYSKAAVIYFDYVALLLLAPPQALPHAGTRLDLARFGVDLPPDSSRLRI